MNRGRVSSAKNLQSLGYRRIVQLLVYLVIIPTVLLLSLGILLMFLGERTNLVLGILTVSLVAVMVTGVVLVIVFVRREANLSELQADFVSKVSHELRTPLTAIRLFVETMERAEADPVTLHKCIGMLSTETARLTSRIERLLDWGRMEAGRRLYDLEPDSAQAIIDEAISQYPPLRYENDVVLTVTVEPNLPRVFADRAAMVDVMVNLLSNAHKYGGSPPRIDIKAFADAKGVKLTVTDNGQGIPRPEHRRIFQKFYRLDDRLSREREGSGLGLAIVKHVIRAHGGQVRVESAHGQGSTFTVWLPKVPPSEGLAPSKSTPPPRAS